MSCYRTKFRLAYMLAALKRLHAPFGSEARRKATEQMDAAETLYRAHRKLPPPSMGDVYDEEHNWSRRQPEWVG